MKHRLLHLVCLLAFCSLAGMEVRGGTILGTDGQKCYPQRFSTSLRSTISVFGDWIETIDRASAPSGVSVSIVDKFNGAQHQSPPFAGRGMVTLRISTSNASPGNKTITLSGGIFGSASFTITVADPPTVSSVDIPTPAEPFNEITATFHGSGLQNAADPASGVIIRDNLTTYITVGGDVRLNSVRVLNSSNSSLQAKLFFSGLIQDATAELTFRKSGNACVPLTNELKHRVRVKSSNVKNFVKSITFPNGNTFDVNSIATVHINLLFPAPGRGSTATQIGGRTVALPTLSGNSNKTVFFKLIPANAFVAVPNGTPINASGFSQVVAATGDDIIPITFRVADCLGGLPGSTNVVKIQTWMHNTNTSQPPEFVEQTFRVRCVQ